MMMGVSVGQEPVLNETGLKGSWNFDVKWSLQMFGSMMGNTGDRISAARIAFGGLAAIPARARATEAALTGRPWNLDSIEMAAAALAEDFQPLTDLRASSAYRLQAAGNLLRRFYFEHGGSSGPVRTAQLAAVPS